MTVPFDQTPEEDTISVGHAIGDSLAGSTDPNMPAVHADSVKLTAAEAMLLGIFREHPGQALTPERLVELAAQAESTLMPADVARIAHSLDRKLGMTRASERVRVVSGVGYILWR